MKPVGFSPAARDDPRQIARGIAMDNPARALSFVAELEDKARQIGDRPQSFPARDEISAGLRSNVHGKYLIFFRDLPSEVRIVRIVHGARDLRHLFAR